MARKLKKRIVLGAVMAMMGMSLVGCSLNTADSYIEKMQTMQSLTNYDYEMMVDFEMTMDDGYEMKGEVELEGEVVGNEWFYALVSYDGQEVTEVILKDDELVINAEMLLDYVETTLGVAGELAEVKESFFKQSDYIVIDFPTEMLLGEGEGDTESYQAQIQQITTATLSAVVEMYGETALTKEDDVYELTLGEDEVAYCIETYVEHVEEIEESMIESIIEMSEEMMDVILDTMEGVMGEEVALIRAEISEEMIEESAQAAFEETIKSIEALEDMEVELTQAFEVKDDVYVSKVTLEGDSVEYTVEQTLTPKDAKEDVSYTYHDGELPEDAVTIGDIMAQVSEMMDAFNTEVVEPEMPSTSDLDTILAEQREIILQADCDWLSAKGYEVSVDDEYGWIDGWKVLDAEMYLQQICTTFYDIDTNEVEMRMFRVQYPKTLSGEEVLAKLELLETEVESYTRADVTMASFQEVTLAEGEEYYSTYYNEDGSISYWIYESDDYREYEITVYEY